MCGVRTGDGLNAPQEVLHVLLAGGLIEVEIGARAGDLVTTVCEALLHMVLPQLALLRRVAARGYRRAADNAPHLSIPIPFYIYIYLTLNDPTRLGNAYQFSKKIWFLFYNRQNDLNT